MTSQTELVGVGLALPYGELHKLVGEPKCTWCSEGWLEKRIMKNRHINVSQSETIGAEHDLTSSPACFDEFIC
jgi:hypothetical protein